MRTRYQDGTGTLLSLGFSPDVAAAVTGNVTHRRRRHSVTWREKKSRYRQGSKPENNAESWRLIQCQHWKIGQWHLLVTKGSAVWTCVDAVKVFEALPSTSLLWVASLVASFIQHFYTSTHKYNERWSSLQDYPALISLRFISRCCLFVHLLAVCLLGLLSHAPSKCGFVQRHISCAASLDQLYL